MLNKWFKNLALRNIRSCTRLIVNCINFLGTFHHDEEGDRQVFWHVWFAFKRRVRNIVFCSKSNRLGGKATELSKNHPRPKYHKYHLVLDPYIHCIPFSQKWEPRLNEKDAHPWYEGMGSWLGHGHLHARRPMEETIGEFCLFNKPN